MSFNGLLTGALAAGSGPLPGRFTLQFKAACASVQVVAVLGKQLSARLSPKEAFSLAASCQLMFECGTTIPERQREVARLLLASPLADPREAARREQAVRQEQWSCVALQLGAAYRIVVNFLHFHNHIEAAAAFAAATARPAVLLPWLGSMADGLLESTSDAATGSEKGVGGLGIVRLVRA